MEKATVYFIKDITPENLIRLYEALGRTLRGKVAVKISTGEPGGHTYLKPKLIGPLVNKVDGTIVECCTAYGGKRQAVRNHWKAIRDHGFPEIAPVEILDERGEIEIPVSHGFHLDKDIVGAGLTKYDSVMILSHFKGHVMGGFGKSYIHSIGQTTDPKLCWSAKITQDGFLESMADACQAVISYVGAKNMVYLNVANRLSVDCDCDPNPAEPEMADLGLFASLDPVALDQACYDAVFASEDPGKAALIERMTSRHAIRTVEAACEHGLGVREYELVTLD